MSWFERHSTNGIGSFYLISRGEECNEEVCKLTAILFVKCTSLDFHQKCEVEINQLCALKL